MGDNYSVSAATKEVVEHWKGSMLEEFAFRWRLAKANEVFKDPNATEFQINMLLVWAMTYDNFELQERCENWKLENMKKTT